MFSWLVRTFPPSRSEALTEQFKKVIAGLGGTIGKIEYWGVKSLAYRIKKNRKAHFSLFNITRPARRHRRDGASDGRSTKTFCVS